MTSVQQSFSFGARELSPRLIKAAHGVSTGYWHLQINATQESSSWYLGFVQGKVIFLGQEKLCWSSLMKILKRFIPRLRTPSSEQAIKQIEAEATLDQIARLGSMLSRMDKLNLLSYDEAVQAIRLSILTDLDLKLCYKPGQAVFVPDFDLVACSPIAGFDLETLLADLSARQKQWQGLQSQIPTPEVVPQINLEALDASNLSPSQKQQLSKLMASPKNLVDIADELARDPLDVARMFANLARKHLVSFSVPSSKNTQADPVGTVPEVFVVDDSPLLLKQFQSLVEHWGYRVNTCSDALKAVPSLLQTAPAVIFLDINMPEASGFELIKQIRRQPQLSSIPMVMLTGEKSVSNQWRAQWANCKFLAKPRSSEEISSFRQELRELLQEIAPVERNTLV